MLVAMEILLIFLAWLSLFHLFLQILVLKNFPMKFFASKELIPFNFDNSMSITHLLKSILRPQKFYCWIFLGCLYIFVSSQIHLSFRLAEVTIDVLASNAKHANMSNEHLMIQIPLSLLMKENTTMIFIRKCKFSSSWNGIDKKVEPNGLIHLWTIAKPALWKRRHSQELRRMVWYHCASCSTKLARRFVFNVQLRRVRFFAMSS